MTLTVLNRVILNDVRCRETYKTEAVFVAVSCNFGHDRLDFRVLSGNIALQLDKLLFKVEACFLHILRPKALIRERHLAEHRELLLNRLAARLDPVRQLTRHYCNRHYWYVFRHVHLNLAALVVDLSFVKRWRIIEDKVAWDGAVV